MNLFTFDLLDLELTHRGQEDTLREVKAISSKMKAAAKEDATSQASLRQYLEKVEKKILDAEKKIIDQVMNNNLCLLHQVNLI